MLNIFSLFQRPNARLPRLFYLKLPKLMQVTESAWSLSLMLWFPAVR
jgi:hypothetical protein